ncbi:hypothetical protein ABMA27_003184 [Loxostege sticticalis]|uniref:Uncharacterized protein n=1 Tax=Loxostege sticticalis TaxID=481309 RepID=A0ABR3HS93_LOXSC
MSVSSFEELLHRITPHIAGKYGRGRPPIEPLEMLGLTVSVRVFCASGSAMKDVNSLLPNRVTAALKVEAS